ncbi:MAG: pyridoxamine 5'-phosphate oxidase family protein [Candidatus Tritonobacter lacicola]|nr:pyridoxamine 5'-phosphate oxidase family protein [Candidatus Tritonobacter lacicola]
MKLEKARAIIREAGYGVVSTCVNGQPRCRPMAFRLTDDFRLWSSTYLSSGKVREFLANPKVEVCFVGKDKVHLRVEGIVDITGGPEKKEKLLEMNPKVRRHFSGGYDEKFVHVEIVPTFVRWTPPGFGEYTVEEI